MSPINPKFSRRSFLQSVGASGALLPLLSTSAAAQQAGGGPKRVVICAWSNGVWREDFWPVGTENDFTLPKILTPLAPFKKDLLVLAGLDVRAHFEDPLPSYGKTPRAGDAHDNFPALLTGIQYAQYRDFYETSGGPSVDVFIGNELAKKGVNTPFKNLVLGGRTGSGYNNTISYAGRDSEGITPETNPRRLFETLFQGRALPAGTIDKTLERRKSVLDYLGKDIEHFSARLGRDDKAKIEAHLVSVRDLERQMTGGSSVACSRPGEPMMDFRANDAYPALLDAQFSLLSAAFRCDLTRVATVMFESTGGNDITFSWLGSEFTGKGDDYPTRQHHDIAHADYRGPEYVARYSRVNQWFMEQVAKFVQKLKDTPEGNGSMLDNTAVVVLNSMGVNHNCHGIGAVVIGGCGGYFKTGRLLRLGEWATKKRAEWKYYWGSPPTGINSIGTNPGDVRGVPHNGLLAGLVNAMGIEATHFGDPKYGGALPQLRG